MNLEIFIDFDLTRSLVDRRANSGICFFLGGNFITWTSKRQEVVSRFIAEGKLRALAQEIMESKWISKILNDLKFNVTLLINVLCDN